MRLLACDSRVDRSLAKIIAVEGGDGAGKGTFTSALAYQMKERDVKVATISFPQYAATHAGAALGRFLDGSGPDWSNPRTIATLYALDRFESLDMLRRLGAQNEYLICDRYIASNVAYQGAKCGEAERGDVFDWIVRLELQTFSLPCPSLNILLRTPLATAWGNVQKKQQRSYTEAKYDVHEADHTLQSEVAQTYDEIAQTNALGPWMVVDTAPNGEMRSALDLASETFDRFPEVLQCLER